MIDEKQYRKALGRFATGIAVATTLDEHGAPQGMTINSFNSVSLDPPLVLWSIDKRSHQLDIFTKSGFYAVNILSADQRAISDRFAGYAEDRFASFDWEKGESGAPLFHGALVKIDCKVEQLIDGGDHVILLGRVIGVSSTDGAPLVYFSGGYRLLGDEPKS